MKLYLSQGIIFALYSIVLSQTQSI